MIPPIQANSDRLTVAWWLCAEIITPLPPMRVKEHASIVARSSNLSAFRVASEIFFPVLILLR